MTINPPKPAGPGLGGLFNTDCTIRRMIAGVDSSGRGFEALSSSAANVPCSTMDLSSSEVEQYGKVSSGKLAKIVLGIETEVGREDEVSVDGETYAVVGVSLRRAGSGVQELILETTVR